MKIVLSTNLDEAQRDVYDMNVASALATHDSPPRVGESVRFNFDKYEPATAHQEARMRKYNYTLRVVAVTYDYERATIEVELHLPPHHESIAAWTKWFKKFRFDKEW